ncbi:MAG: hypothetical protein J1F23_08805 [Oscillospiraceae bacterium]|nr:hypothetical protein [Oscillospiraceae bacterium]
MIEYHCDKCGKKINMGIDGVQVYAERKNVCVGVTEENYHLCLSCFKKVREFISSAEKK